MNVNAEVKIETDPRMQLEVALATALPELEGAKKKSANPHFKSKYADLGAVIDAVRPIADHGIWFRQVLHECERGVTVETLYTGFGATISAGTLFMPADKANAQGFGSALTYARRYALQAAFGLASEDDDGNAASEPRKAPPEPAPAAVKNWGGRYPTKTALGTACKVHQAELRRLADEGNMDDFEGYLTSPEYSDFITQAEMHCPVYLHGGEQAPPEFVPTFNLEKMAKARILEREPISNLRAG